MVSNASNRGLTEWIWQRVSAVVVVVYLAVLLSFIFCSNTAINYVTWVQFYSQTSIRVLTILATASILWHAWIGLWTVFTDYVKLPCLRKLLEILVLLFLATCGIWVVILMCG
jgi:succinate dehydrogenase / fumarate reductase, membrane anchor subunit